MLNFNILYILSRLFVFMEMPVLGVHRLPHGKDLPLPAYAHAGDAGLDLCSAEDHVLRPGETAVLKTGVCMAIPAGHVGLIWDRSGLAAKNSVHTLAGVVDSTYRGELQVVLKNSGNVDFPITRGMRIAQMLIQPVLSVTVQESDSLDDTARGKEGFGSTGK